MFVEKGHTGTECLSQSFGLFIILQLTSLYRMTLSVLDIFENIFSG